MSFRVIHCDQGSPEWLQARAGVITASNFKIARSRTGGLVDMQQKFVNAYRGDANRIAFAAAEMAGYKNPQDKADELMANEKILKALRGEAVGEFTEAARNLAFRIAFERVSGKPMDEGFQTWQMERGHELEPDARREHEIQAGVLVERAGFIVTEDGVFGASADGLISTDGGSEYKCLVSATSLRPVLVDHDNSDFMDQVQGCMWISRRKWWHLGYYCPQLEAIGYPLHLVPVARDDNYIAALEADLMEFKAEVDRMERVIRSLSRRSVIAAQDPHFLQAA